VSILKIGNQIQKVIKEKGLKQGYVAKELGMTDKTMSEIIHGKRKLSAEELIGISMVLGISTDIFLPNQSEQYGLSE